jgi:hypothetical protein
MGEVDQGRRHQGERIVLPDRFVLILRGEIFWESSGGLTLSLRGSFLPEKAMRGATARDATGAARWKLALTV